MSLPSFCILLILAVSQTTAQAIDGAIAGGFSPASDNLLHARQLRCNIPGYVLCEDFSDCKAPGGQCCSHVGAVGIFCWPGTYCLADRPGKCCPEGSDCKERNPTPNRPSQTAPAPSNRPSPSPSPTLRPIPDNSSPQPNPSSRVQPVGLKGRRNRPVNLRDEVEYEGGWAWEVSCNPDELGNRVSTDAEWSVEYETEVYGVVVSNSVKDNGGTSTSFGVTDGTITNSLEYDDGYDNGEGGPTGTSTGCTYSFAFEFSQSYMGVTNTISFKYSKELTFKRQLGGSESYYQLDQMIVFATKEDYEAALKGYKVTKVDPKNVTISSGGGDRNATATSNPTSSVPPDASLGIPMSVPPVFNPSDTQVPVGAPAPSGTGQLEQPGIPISDLGGQASKLVPQVGSILIAALTLLTVALAV